MAVSIMCDTPKDLAEVVNLLSKDKTENEGRFLSIFRKIPKESQCFIFGFIAGQVEGDDQEWLRKRFRSGLG